MRRNAIALVALLITAGPACALTYSLASGNESWPADKKNAIVAAMNEAVAIYNANGYFDKAVTANYNASVPTAQASYSGWIDFGGSINTRVAMHEIAHTLGVGQYSTWTNGGWSGAVANARVKLYDGQNATVGTGGSHFWPYGLNYDSEDGAVARIRHVRMVSALRRDMGIIGDADSDGMPDDWEIFNFGNTSQTASADPDGDNISNLDEYATDSNPNLASAKSGRVYQLRVQFSGKLAEVVGAQTADGANVQQYTNNGHACQKWIAYPVSGGWWKLVNVNSGKCMETAGSSNADGGNVDQNTWAGTAWQQWRFADAGGGYWSIYNKASGKVLDVNGVNSADNTNIQQWTDWRGGGQKWAFDEVIPFTNNAVFSLNAMHSNKVLDVQSPNLNDGANVGQWDWNGGNWQKWRVESLGSGWIRLVNVNSGKALEVAGSSTANGGNVQQWAWLGNNWQQWRVEGVDQLNVYRVINRGSGLSMDVEGASTANGANVFQWQYLGGGNQKWRFDAR